MLALTYVSETTTDFTQSQLNDLASAAAEFNRAHDLTGYLYYEDKQFIQYLEGPEGQVLGLIEKIENDPRHTMICKSQRNVENRIFTQWDMKIFTGNEWSSFQLEHIWRDILIWNKDTSYEDMDEKIWRIVERISDYKKKQQN